jgi:hypothetical protein
MTYPSTSAGTYYLVVGGYDIVFSNNFGISIPSGTASGDGTLNYKLSGQLTSTNFTIDGTNKYRVYSFDIES